MFWFYRRSVTGWLQTGEFLMNGWARRSTKEAHMAVSGILENHDKRLHDSDS
jgi:hypothetical protein